MKIINWNLLNLSEQQACLARPGINTTEDAREKTLAIIQQVRARGDSAVTDFMAEFDKVKLNNFAVSAQEIALAEQQVTAEVFESIRFAINRITTYHQALIPKTIIVDSHDGVVCERQPRPIQRVGLYVPGGSAPLISTVMMLAIPASLANCRLRVLCTPPKPDGSIDANLLVAAKACGIQQIYKVGGVQAIAAMAYGTETIPKVDKIFGPGNSWVTQAKLLCAQDPQGASIDLPAGPSELLIIADEQANPNFVSADLLSQAEHGVDSQVLLITPSLRLAEDVCESIKQQLPKLPRQNIAAQALQNSRAIITQSIEQAVNISNRYAPEHLILQLNKPEYILSKITCAGAVFIGPWTPETVGDYVTGSNHVLPTYGYARCYSGLSVSDFMTFINFQFVNERGLKVIGPHAEKIAELEGLHAHKFAVSVRLQKLGEGNE